jgi:hypothetical protein
VPQGRVQAHQVDQAARKGYSAMLYTLAVILVVLWLLGFVAFHVGGGLIHLLLVVALVVVVFQLISGRRVV